MRAIMAACAFRTDTDVFTLPAPKTRAAMTGTPTASRRLHCGADHQNAASRRPSQLLVSGAKLRMGIARCAVSKLGRIGPTRVNGPRLIVVLKNSVARLPIIVALGGAAGCGTSRPVCGAGERDGVRGRIRMGCTIKFS